MKSVTMLHTVHSLYSGGGDSPNACAGIPQDTCSHCQLKTYGMLLFNTAPQFLILGKNWALQVKIIQGGLLFSDQIPDHAVRT